MISRAVAWHAPRWANGPTLAVLAPAYRPRRPSETVLYGVVRDHLETFLAHARATYEAPLPRYVEEELRGYLRCGIFAHGFVMCRCDACGYDLLVAFSCKARAVCPSCAGRRMANVAAHLVDRVLPPVPVRQWVLSVPFELRALAAFRADVLSALARMFIEAVFTRYRSWAKREGLGDAPTGAVTHVQRFGSSVNLHVHFHSMLLDGVFSRDEQGRVRFHAAPPPTREELAEVVRRVRRRALAWLERRKLLGFSEEAGASQEPQEQTSLDACASIAMQRGAVQALRDDPRSEHEGPGGVEAPPREEDAVELDGFNLHASVAIAADDDVGRERLMRYGARPPLALDRLRRLPDGRIAYRIKKLRDGRAKHRIMTPLEFLARLAAIVPPPKFPLLRYAGVLAPASKWRSDVVPRAPEAKPCGKVPEEKEHAARSDMTKASDAEPNGARVASTPGTTAATRADASALAQLRSAAAAPEAQAADSCQLLTPNVLRVKHWDRLLAGALYAATPRLDWASLLRRSFSVDVLECAKCGGRLHVLGEVTEPGRVMLMLESLRMPTDAPHVARARDPTELLGAEVG